MPLSGAVREHSIPSVRGSKFAHQSAESLSVKAVKQSVRPRRESVLLKAPERFVRAEWLKLVELTTSRCRGSLEALRYL